MNSVGIDVGKKTCRASIKDTGGAILSELSFSNDRDGIERLIIDVKRHGKARAVIESTGNMWMRIHDMLEDHGIDTVLANPVNSRCEFVFFHPGEASIFFWWRVRKFQM